MEILLILDLDGISLRLTSFDSVKTIPILFEKLKKLPGNTERIELKMRSSEEDVMQTTLSGFTV